MVSPVLHDKQRMPNGFYVAAIVFGVATGTLMLQIVQTRIYAVVFWNHLVYFIISLALLGFGISGTWLAFGPGTRIARFLTLPNSATAFVATAVLSSLFVPQWGTSVSAMLTSQWHLLRLMMTYVTAVLPYFFAGWILGVVYRDYAERIHVLYFFDLVGAGVGCLAVLALLRPLGAVGLVLVACALVGLPVFGRTWATTERMSYFVQLALIVAALAGLFVFRQEVEGRIVPDVTKGFSTFLREAPPGDQRVVEFSEWNSIARTDVVGSVLTPQKRIFADGDGWTDIAFGTKGVPTAYDPQNECLLPHRAPYILQRPLDSVLIIGSGGGWNVWAALRAGAQKIDAVEINATTVHLVRGQYAESTDRLFFRPEVALWNEEGRSFVRSRDTLYDTIVINAIDTFAALNSGAYMLAENYLYTVEGMCDYLTHLTPQGVLHITRWDYAGETPRLFVIMLEAMYVLGWDSPDRHIVAMAKDGWTAIVVSRPSFSENETSAMRSHALQHGGKFYFPLAPEERALPFQKDLNEYAEARACGFQERFLDAYGYNIGPVWDDGPFFFHYERLQNIWRVPYERDPLDYVRGHWPSLVLSSLLVLLSVALAVFVFLPLLKHGRGGLPGFGLWVVYFCCLGFSFIFVEISLMQRFALLLGHPARSMALVLACLLVSAGIGSHAKERLSLRLGWSLALAILAVLAAAFVYPYLVTQMLGFPLWLRGCLTVVLVAPMGFFMGMPFPSGIRRVSEQARDSVPWMWGVNGGATVLGSILAIWLAICLSFTAVLIWAAVAYGLALAIHSYLGRSGVSRACAPSSLP